MIITIDGGSGTGKSTLAKALADALGFGHLDSGGVYRSLSWYILKEGCDPSDVAAVKALLPTFDFHMREGHFFVGEDDVTDQIRTPEISRVASQVSAYPIVRETLMKYQREFAKSPAVFEGRDMGSVVFPDADIKFFLTASAKVRAERRTKELQEKYPDRSFSFDETLRDIEERDQRDKTRAVAPLVCPDGATVIDTSNLTVEQVLSKLEKRVKRYMKRRIAFLAKNMRPLYRLTIFVTYLVSKLFYKFKIYGLEYVYKGGGLIAPNHVSFFDPPIVATAWPEEIHFLARDTLFRGPFGKFISAVNSHPIKRNASNITIFKTVEGLLREGKKVLLFPEGSRSKTGELQEIKPGITLIVTRAESAIIPVYIHGADKIWPKGKKFPKLFKKVACVFGKPIHYSDYAHLPKKEAMVVMTERLRTALHDLRVWYKNGAEGLPQ